MTKRDFFRLVIKLFGLYSIIISIFYFIPANLNYLSYGFDPVYLIFVIGGVLLSIALYWLLIRKSDMIIDTFKLDKGYDSDTVELNGFTSQRILQLAIVLLGGYLIIMYLPEFFEYTFLAFKEEVSRKGIDSFGTDYFGTSSDYFYWVVAGLNILIGYLLLSNHHKLSRWLDSFGKKSLDN